jgi:hypothetical protein
VTINQLLIIIALRGNNKKTGRTIAGGGSNFDGNECKMLFGEAGAVGKYAVSVWE